MKNVEKVQAISLRKSGYSIKDIARELGVAKSSVSVWVRDVELSPEEYMRLRANPFSEAAVEKRRQTRIINEESKRNLVITRAQEQISRISDKDLFLIGVMLYWAEGGKTQRMVRFSNGDPNMIKIMMAFFRRVCEVPEGKLRGYIHIHPHLDHIVAEKYWSDVTGIPLDQFFKTYTKPNKSSQNKKDTLPYGVLDIYVLDTKLFLKITGWARGIFTSY
jgi:transposase-like protein